MFLDSVGWFITIKGIMMTDFERTLRMNIRNAWLAESSEDIRNEAKNRAAQNKWFEAYCLLELASED